MSNSRNDSPSSSYMDWNDSDPDPEPELEEPEYVESSDSEGMADARSRPNSKPDSDGKSNGTRSKVPPTRSECSSSPDCKKPCPPLSSQGTLTGSIEQSNNCSLVSSSVSSYKSTSSSPSSVPPSRIEHSPTTSSKPTSSNGFIKCSDLVDIDPEEDDFEYQVLSPENVVQHMIEIIREVNAVLNLPHTAARMLLTHFKWDKERLLERFFDGDPDTVFEEAHLINPIKSTDSDCSTELATSKSAARTSQSTGASSARSGSSQSSCSARRNGPTTRSMVNSGQPSVSSLVANMGGAVARGAVECSICARAVSPECLAGVGCDHVFCTSCWVEYLRLKILQEGSSNSISCPAYRCDIYVDDEFVMRMIGSRDELVRRKYQHLITNSFVACNRLLRWCSKPDCGNAIRVRHVDRRPVRCTCGQIMCFQCGNAWHDPVKCEYLRRWIKKCDDDSETSNWIAANTKECPKCHVTIEKDGGCNHMICKNNNCKYEFCWVCMDSWEPHGSSWYNCTRYNEEGSKHARDQQDRSRSALQRYLFYYNRYMNHMQSLRFEHKLYTSVHEKMEAMQTVANMSWIEVQFLQRAVDVLCQCRRTLMYTYVFAFYLRRNNQSLIFEENQKDLAFATEQLSEYLERDSVDTLTHLMPGPRTDMNDALLSFSAPFASTGSYPSSLPLSSTASRHQLPVHHNSHNRPRTTSSSVSAAAAISTTSSFIGSAAAPTVADSMAALAASQSHAHMLEAIQRVKQLVQDKTRYCDHRRRLLLQHVHDGYEKELWEYTEPCHY